MSRHPERPAGAVGAFFRRLGWLRRRSDREAELREELQFHLDLEAEQQRRDGVPSGEAQWAARRDLGNVAMVQEQTRAAWGWARLEQVARDVAYGLRLVRRHRGFAAVAIATLALGIGGIAAMFSAFDAVLIRPMPYVDADRLVMIWLDMGKSDVVTRHNPTPAEWIEWRRLNTVFTDLATSQPVDATLSGEAGPEQAPARKVSWTFWSVLGARPELGRVFTEAEDTGGAKVVLISHDLWQRRFGGDPHLIGRTITVNDEPYEVLGIMPRGFYFLPSRDIDVWMPATFPAWMRTNFTWHDAHIVARMKPGVTLDAARQSMAALSRQVTAKDFRGPHSVFVVPLREDIAGRTRSALILLLSASAAVLLIACVNLANLLLSRSATRAPEVAVRRALGASRGRLIAQFLTESLVLAGLGTICGLALALPVMTFLQRLVPEAMGTAAPLTPDWRVLGFSAAIGVAAALVFGLAPALRGSRGSPQDGLRDAGRGTSGALGHWFRHALIVAETALAVVLLTCGGLLVQTYRHLQQTDIGFRSERLLTFETPLFRYKDFQRRVAYVNAEVEKIAAIPGVVSAASIDIIPFTNFANATFYRLEGQTTNPPTQVALIRNVTHGYFATAGARVVEGRDFAATDRTTDAPVAIVNEIFAKRHFAGRSPIGQRFKFGNLGTKGYWYTIVGIVKPIPESGVLEELKPAVYRVIEQCDQIGNLSAGIVVRTAVEPSSIIPAARQAIWSLDKDQPIARIQTMDALVARQLSTPSESSALLGAFALLALLLASLGIYGVLSNAVAQRTTEIGVRMAMGATSQAILLSFQKRGLLLTLAGLVVGLALSAAAARAMTSVLYGFQPAYGSTIAVVSGILLAVAALAAFVPARRASRVDPVVALRSE